MKRSRVRSARGQGITEYCYCLAFVACLIAMAFSLRGNFFTSISQSYSSVNGSLGQMNQAVAQQGGGTQ